MKRYYSKKVVKEYQKDIQTIIDPVRKIFIELAKATVHHIGTPMTKENIEKLSMAKSSEIATNDVYVLLENGITTAFYNKNIKRWVIGRPFPVAYENEVFEHKFLTEDQYVTFKNRFSNVILGIIEFETIMQWLNSEK